MKDGDIYRWKYKQEVIDKYYNPYWCKSQIAIWRKNGKLLVDTYWHSQDNTIFNEEDINNKLELTFVANINDLERCEKHMFNNYDDKDCVDISHANNSNSGFYIKKGAKPSIKKKKEVLKKQIEETQHRIESEKRHLCYLIDTLDNLSDTKIL